MCKAPRRKTFIRNKFFTLLKKFPPLIKLNIPQAETISVAGPMKLRSGEVVSGFRRYFRFSGDGSEEIFNNCGLREKVSCTTER